MRSLVSASAWSSADQSSIQENNSGRPPQLAGRVVAGFGRQSDLGTVPRRRLLIHHAGRSQRMSRPCGELRQGRQHRNYAPNESHFSGAVQALGTTRQRTGNRSGSARRAERGPPEVRLASVAERPHRHAGHEHRRKGEPHPVQVYVPAHPQPLGRLSWRPRNSSCVRSLTFGQPGASGLELSTILQGGRYDDAGLFSRSR
jgi:hypothetical protein